MASAAAMMDIAYAPLTGSLSTASVSGSSSGSSATTGACTGALVGGSGSFTYAWTPTAGGISANSPASLSTTFSATGLGVSESRSGVFTLTATDIVTGQVLTVGSVTAYVERSAPALSASASGSSNGTASSYSTTGVFGASVSITPSGGVGPYTYNWFKTTFDVASVEPSGASARLVASLAPGQSITAGMKCVVGDAIGQTYEVNVAGTLSNTSPPAPPLSASVDDANPYGVDTGNTVTTNGINVLVTGGVGPYGYAWTRISGVGSASGGASAAFIHTFAAYGSEAGTFRCTITDAIGQTATVTISAGWTYWAGIFEP